MTIKAFNVEYENNVKDVYFAGQTVKGYVNLTLTKPKKICAIRWVAWGKAKISWGQARNSTHKDLDGRDHTHSVSRFYSDVEKYFKIEKILWGRATNNENDSIMAAGNYRLPFSFEIPSACPSSFESRYGRIRYYCKAVICRTYKTNSTTKRAFTVVAPVDLNNYPTFSFAVSRPKTKIVHGFLGFTKSGEINYELKLPRTGYVQGELIPFEVKVDNNSNTVVNHASIKLVQNVTVIANNKHTRTSLQTVFGAKRGDVQPKQNLVWKNDSLKVPLLPPTLTSCRVLKIEHFLELGVCLKGFHFCDSVTVPFFVGNIPLRSATSSLNLTNEFQHATNATVFSSPTEQYMESDLPSYDEVVFGESQQIRDAARKPQ